MNEKCGCHLTTNTDVSATSAGIVTTVKIIYCPTHAAAFEMKKALEDGCSPGRLQTFQDRERFRNQAEQALALCKEADHGKPASS